MQSCLRVTNQLLSEESFAWKIVNDYNFLKYIEIGGKILKLFVGLFYAETHICDLLWRNREQVARQMFLLLAVHQYNCIL